MVYIFSRFLCWLFFKIFLRLKITGQEFIPQKGGCIVASNHISFLDPPLMGSAINRPSYFMAKSELFNNKLFAKFFKMAHTFPVKRNEQDHSAITTALDLLKKGKVLVIFPEGGRNIDGSKEIQLGVGFLAQLANVPVLPALVVGSDKALPADSKFVKLHKTEVYFGQPIYPQEVAQTGLRRKELYKLITQRVVDKINELRYSYENNCC